MFHALTAGVGQRAKFGEAKMSPLDAAKNFKDTVARIHKKQTPDDERYKELRSDAETLLNIYADDPLSTDLLNKCAEVIHRIDQLSLNNMKGYNFERARSNVVYLAASTKRINYASYMAGKWSASDDISKEVKVWMHNSAADGAITLYESLCFIYDYLRKEARSDKNAQHAGDIVNVYRTAAFIDAKEFLDFADEIVPACCLTQYNRAKLLAYSAEKLAEIKQAIEILKNVTPLNPSEFHAAEVYWHKDNYHMFQTKDSELKRIIGKYSDEESAVEIIDHVLEKNYKIADQIQDEKGEKIWESGRDGKLSKSLAVAASIGALSIASTYAGIDPDTLTDTAAGLLELLTSQADLLNSYLDTNAFGSEARVIASLGGGGLAMGGGGLA
ncbi:MAG: hypothetical protein O6944_12270 [Gammaproteobacteria bacterium]|nr:hypothetical protein [Gammaproteobacteria bacterium]